MYFPPSAGKSHNFKYSIERICIFLQIVFIVVYVHIHFWRVQVVFPRQTKNSMEDLCPSYFRAFLACLWTILCFQQVISVTLTLCGVLWRILLHVHSRNYIPCTSVCMSSLVLSSFLLAHGHIVGLYWFSKSLLVQQQVWSNSQTFGQIQLWTGIDVQWPAFQRTLQSILTKYTLPDLLQHLAQEGAFM